MRIKKWRGEEEKAVIKMCHEGILNFQFGSWTYSGKFIDLQISKANENDSQHDMDLSYYVQNGEWTLLGKLSLVMYFMFVLAMFFFMKI